MALVFAVMHVYTILIFLLLLSIGIDKLTEWFTTPGFAVFKVKVTVTDNII